MPPLLESSIAPNGARRPDGARQGGEPWSETKTAQVLKCGRNRVAIRRLWVKTLKGTALAPLIRMISHIGHSSKVIAVCRNFPLLRISTRAKIPKPSQDGGGDSGRRAGSLGEGGGARAPHDPVLENYIIMSKRLREHQTTLRAPAGPGRRSGRSSTDDESWRV